MKRACFIATLLLCFFHLSFSQKLNRYNKKEHRTGKWVTYSDSAKTKKSFDGKFRDGITVGKCLYYSPEGILEKKEVNRRKKMKLTFYYPNGTIKQKGNAKLENHTDRIHFYFYGKWKQYNTDGKLIAYLYYTKGDIVRTESLIKTTNAKDTFCIVLSEIDIAFANKNKSLLDTLALCWNSPALAEKYRQKIYNADSATFKRVENNINLYGYPTKAECKEAANVPFFIISHAPCPIREKYIELFKAAAAMGNISKISLAFYIDKIKVTKGEKQIYGTQFYMNKERRDIYYPSVDPENLAKRRKEMGLEN